ncbi:hypothetical protein, variant [Puccinia graminis f. sp. tritici CRL 75-36-700-3]|uniref:Zinc-ribbon 15 domain-containing protein n=1 Tax=Puccinia graminis f. sp. tritici (strain CRL 75-36-700-3 / race SCCL) TaxID=418459 RepID=H6QRH6_PUCGT|nr:hypothetical protein, variant [Puccinia graminis f. sp. tritici CRL 75-36-700-3]EHS63258.1 hypothetical protein, variant [Puccinia graminis f. sp. tritici CRL 75-36-700-3]
MARYDGWVGCPVKVTSGAPDGPGRACPKCHNGSVFKSHRRRWIEICFVSLIPCSSRQVWHCNICNWQANVDDSFQPAFPAPPPPPPGAGAGAAQPQMVVPQMQMIPPTSFAPPSGPPPPTELQYPGGYGR